MSSCSPVALFPLFEPVLDLKLIDVSYPKRSTTVLFSVAIIPNVALILKLPFTALLLGCDLFKGSPPHLKEVPKALLPLEVKDDP